MKRGVVADQNLRFKRKAAQETMIEEPLNDNNLTQLEKNAHHMESIMSRLAEWPLQRRGRSWNQLSNVFNDELVDGQWYLVIIILTMFNMK